MRYLGYTLVGLNLFAIASLAVPTLPTDTWWRFGDGVIAGFALSWLVTSRLGADV
jgi:hypothetical protein